VHDHVDVGDEFVDGAAVEDVALPVGRLGPALFRGAERPAGHPDDLADVRVVFQRRDRRLADLAGRSGDTYAQWHGRKLPVMAAVKPVSRKGCPTTTSWR